jgi:hypothetical protein
MILVAGLAVAGLLGIAAAFFLSIRSGNGGKRDSRVRSAGPGRNGADRRAGSGESAGRPVNGRRAANNSRTANASQAADRGSGNYRAEARTGPNTVMDFGNAGEAARQAQVPTVAAPVFAAGSSDDTPGDAWPGDAGPDISKLGTRSAARLARDADADAAATAKTPKSRRRVGFRKGAELDEEMWPAESFGVSDDQFWDDLASDKPLTTTARSAQPNSGAPKRPQAAVPPPDARSGQKPGDARTHSNDGAPGQDKVPGNGGIQGNDGARVSGRRAWHPGTSPESRPGPAQPGPVRAQGAPAQTGPAQTGPAQTGPAQTGPAQTGPAQTGPAHASPFMPAPTHAPRPFPAAGQSARSSTQPTETRGRRYVSADTGPHADEDPLTSAAFSLRSSGPVDGHSQQAPRRSYDIGREQYNPGVSQETRPIEPMAGRPRPDGSRRSGPSGTVGVPSGTAAIEVYRPATGPASPYAGTAYPYSGQPYSGHAPETSATQPPDTSPYVAVYGHAGSDDPRRPNDTRSHTRPGGNGAGNRAPRQAHPQNGGYQNGSYPSGYQDRGRSAPYDPREEHRRLTNQR